MRILELLAPARNADIGIAAIDCGADAVYIAGPDFGARKDAGNPVGEISRLCDYAHRFGARVFVTFNILVRDEELGELHSEMLDAQKAGADAFIIRDPRICGFEDITVPLHASTQCSIRDAQRAKEFIEAGCSRVVLERELTLEQIRKICSEVPAEVEVFVHGALCVCYSGQCTLSERLTGRSADRGECIQACRNLYDIRTLDGKTILRNKAVLSLKDYNLLERMEELADAGACSFKIEGRLKNASYVKNTVRAYSNAIDSLVAKRPEEFCRASFGKAEGGFIPDLDKTFNRGYTELFIDGKRGAWACMDNPKSMGEFIGTIASVTEKEGCSVITLAPAVPGLRLENGDGLAVNTGREICGFRADVCRGLTIRAKHTEGLRTGQKIWRNSSSAFERELENNMPKRYVDVSLDIRSDGKSILVCAHSEDGREASVSLGGEETAANPGRLISMLESGLSKHTGVFDFHIGEMSLDGISLPLLSASRINGARREIADLLDGMPVRKRSMASGSARKPFIAQTGRKEGELMRTKYCLRHELGLCPKQGKAPKAETLILVNNSRSFHLNFDCRNCEMTVTEIQSS
ncbi:MAG: U32 family peptidase [Bacteroidales bacterium]|nr:U32 family peptidase [Bacteroidales bacterium]